MVTARDQGHFTRSLACCSGARVSIFGEQSFHSPSASESLSLGGQEKVTKENATPASAQDELCSSCSLRCSSSTGRQTTRPSLASDSLPFPGGRLRSSALLQGTRKIKGTPSASSRAVDLWGDVTASQLRHPGASRDPLGHIYACVERFSRHPQKRYWRGRAVVLRYLRTNGEGVSSPPLYASLCLSPRRRRVKVSNRE